MRFESLEREFTYYKFKHQYRVLLDKVTDYYKTLEQSEINLSGIYHKTPEQRAKDDILHIIKTDVNKFHGLYEKAYMELI